MQKCSCGKDTRTFEACTPLGCNAVLLCIGCYKQVEKCVCQNNNSMVIIDPDPQTKSAVMQ